MRSAPATEGGCSSIAFTLSFASFTEGLLTAAVGAAVVAAAAAAATATAGADAGGVINELSLQACVDHGFQNGTIRSCMQRLTEETRHGVQVFKHAMRYRLRRVPREHTPIRVPKIRSDLSV